HFGAAVLGLAGHGHGRYRHAADFFDHAVLRHATVEFHEVLFAVAAHREAQPRRQRVHARHAHAVQTAGDLVAVLVELADGVQLGHHDLSGAALGIVLVVHLQAGRHAAAVVGDGDGVVRVNDHLNVVTVSGQCFVDRIVEHFEHKVMQTGAIRCIPDVHPRPLAHGLQTFEDLNGRRAVA